MSIYEEFYNTMKEWIVSDYRTPKIKAEVIIDMLISDYVADIVNDPDLPGEKDAVLLAKEFPINGYKGVRNSPAVDYLVKKGDVLYLIELKTDRSSFSSNQLDRMIKARENGIKELMDHYIKVLAAKRDPDKRHKYLYQVNRLLAGLDKKVPVIDRLPADENDPVFDPLRSGLGFSRIKILYIVLNKECIDDSVSGTDISVRSLDEYNPRVKKEQWEKINDILQACTDREA